jgi:hypothetical protein
LIERSDTTALFCWASLRSATSGPHRNDSLMSSDLHVPSSPATENQNARSLQPQAMNAMPNNSRHIESAYYYFGFSVVPGK